MDRFDDLSREPAEGRRLGRRDRWGRPPSKAAGRPGTLRPASRPPGRLVAACAGVILFVALAAFGALRQVWLLFFASCVLTAVTIAFAIVEGEQWRGGGDQES